MKKILVTGLLVAALPLGANADDCLGGGTRISNASLLLSGNTVCGSSPVNSDTWQEQHRSDGQLWEYALGTDPVDPTHQEGNWSASTTSNEVTYTYLGGNSYLLEIWQVTSGGSYYFCDGSNHVANASIVSGITSCL